MARESGAVGDATGERPGNAPRAASAVPSGVCTIQDLVARHHADVYRYAYHLAGAVHDAEDLCQQAFLLAQERIHQLRDAEQARSWLFAILRNGFLKGRERRQPMDDAAAFDTVDDSDGWESALGWGGRFVKNDDETFDAERLHAALQELPETHRVVLLMYFFEDRSYREIAEQLQLPAGTVMSRLSRAKCHLREILQPAANRRSTT